MPFVKNDPNINRGGRPKGSFSLVGLLRNELEKEIPSKTKDKKTYASVLIRKMLDKAIKDGDPAMIKDIINRIDGLPVRRLGLDDETKEIIVKWKD